VVFACFVDLVIALRVSALFAVTVMLVIHSAYRDSVLAAPLSTRTIVGLTAASTVGIVLLGAHLRLGVAGGAVGFAGLVLTIVGLTVLARHAHHPKTAVAVS